MIIILTLVAVFLFLGLGLHLIYPLVLRKLLKNNGTHTFSEISNAQKVKDSTLPYVSVIIPVYNEELVIERRLTNIFETTYPKAKLEVIVIDSGSEDRTRAIILGKFQDKVVLLTENERRGKAHAINLALGNCSGEIVIITDGPALYDKETIFHLVAPFSDPSIGGVSVLYKIQNSNENQITASENAFWSYKEKIRLLESKAYSTSWLSGEACAFRHRVINRVSDDTLADDSNIALQLIAKGYRVIVNQNSHFTEKSPSQIDDFFRVKVRRALGGLQEAIRFRSFLFDRRYGCFGLIIFPYRFFSHVLSPIALVAALILLVISAIEVGRYIGIYLLTAIIVAVLIVFMFRFRSTVLTYLYTELVMLTALFLFLNKRMSVRWTQSKTTRL